MTQKGTGVRGVDLGAKVVLHPLMTCGLCRACRRGEDRHRAEGQFVGLAVDGGMAQFVRTNPRALVPLASTTDTREVAPRRGCRDHRLPHAPAGGPPSDF